MKEFEIYKINPSTVDEWLEEIFDNKHLLFSIARGTKGPIVELRLIFREGPDVRRDPKEFYNLEQNIEI